MMRMGIIGAENSHTAAIAKLLNVEKAIPDVQVTHLWGESPDFVKASQEKVAIPNVVETPAAMLGQVDCVMVDHRNGKHHLKAVTPFVKAKIPVFVDKPMSISLAECKRFLALRKRLRTPVTTMSAIPHQGCVAGIKARLAELGEVKAVHFMGPGDPKSPYGGVFFYGIHQVDLMVELLGAGAVSATAKVPSSSVKVATCVERLPVPATWGKAPEGPASAQVYPCAAMTSGVKVTAVYPGGTDTDFRAIRRPDYMRPESVARMIGQCGAAPEDVVVHEMVYRPMVETNF